MVTKYLVRTTFFIVDDVQYIYNYKIESQIKIFQKFEFVSVRSIFQFNIEVYGNFALQRVRAEVICLSLFEKACNSCK